MVQMGFLCSGPLPVVMVPPLTLPPSLRISGVVVTWIWSAKVWGISAHKTIDVAHFALSFDLSPLDCLSSSCRALWTRTFGRYTPVK